ncbi:MAG: NAD(P)H-dependent oxidoreductase [Proteobacteria bacterium]|nr:NAD(P)H-dependent oxidoreductase [Pseudomonadota bacterium]
MNPKHIAVLVGSLRENSFSQKIAHALAEQAPASLQLDVVEIGDLPLYNPDLETDAPPAPWQRFREQMKLAQGVIFVTPEYNRSMPAAVKNALDVGSRPYGKNVFGGKPGAIVSSSPGAIGGFGANHHLRQSLVFLDVLPMQQPEAYLSGVDKLLAADGRFVPATAEFLGKFMTAFSTWVDRVARG